MSDSQVTTLDDAPAVAVATKTKAKTAVAPVAEGQAMFNVIVHPTGDEGGNRQVDLCYNGFLYQLPRGVACKVPAGVLEGLQNAITRTYTVNGSEVIERDIPRFPFTATPA